MNKLCVFFVLQLLAFNAFAYPGAITIKEYKYLNLVNSNVRFAGQGISNGELYAYERVEKRLIVMNPETGKILREQPMMKGDEVHSLYVDEKFLYLGVVSRIENRPHFISVLDKKTFSELKRINMAYDNYFPHQLSVDKNGIAYVSTYGDGTDPKIMRFDINTGKKLETIVLPKTTSPYGQAPLRVTVDENKLYFTYYGIYRYDLSNKEFFQFPFQIVTRDGIHFFQIPDQSGDVLVTKNKVLVADDDMGIEVMNKETGTIEAHIPMLDTKDGQPFRCYGLFMEGNRVYAIDEISVTIFELPDELK